MRRAVLLAVWLTVVATAAATHAGTHAARPGKGFTVLGHAAAGGGYSADVVGERHYAYLSSRAGENDCPAQGVRVYDLATPRRPRHVATFGRIPGTWTEKTIVRRVHTAGFDGVLAATSVQACTNGFGGFVLYDVTSPAKPKLLAQVRTEPRGSHEIWLATARGHAWVYTAEAATEFAAAPGSFGFHIFDVSDPRAPTEVGGWSACRDLHECSPLQTDPANDRRVLVHSVITNAAATRAYLSYWSLGTVILDISDPARPRYLGRTARGQGNAHSAWLFPGEKMLIETHETLHGRPVVWNVADPAHAVRLATVRLPFQLEPGGTFADRLPLEDSVHDPKTVGRRAYFSWYGQGVALFDVENPRKPRFVARFRPPSGHDRHGLLCPGGDCTAVWGVFPTAHYILASDMNTGLWVLKAPAG
ncbi:MAG TPA: hypothetical protein VE757_10230 [Gaiellaceae bacterium]|nr:hypothetical protein [Gaiellaceae bacterium]